MNLVHLKKVSESESKVSDAPALAKEPVYPYGLVINLQKEELDKLGLKELPGIGEAFMLEGKCVVKSISAGASEVHEHASVELQLTHLGIESMEEEEEEEHDSADTAAKMFDKMK